MALYVKLTEDEIKETAANYGLELSSYEGIVQGVQNTNYLLNTDKGKFILTICEPEINPDDLPFFNSAMLYAAQIGLPAPLPIKNKEGSFTESIKNKPSGIVTFLEGAQALEADLDKIKELGYFLALMHIKMINFHLQRKNPLCFENVKKLILKNEKINQISPNLQAEIEHEINAVEKALPKNLPAGFIHADLFMDNVFFQNSKVSGVIDFYFSCTDFLAYDLAVTANAWCFDENGHKENKEKFFTLISAYESVRPLLPEEKQAFPLLARRAALRFFATRAWDKNYPKSEAVVGVKDPMEYVSKIRAWQNFKPLS